jgi:hypothetical protein
VNQSSVFTPTPQQRLAFMKYLVATGDVDEGDAEPPPVCVRCRREWRLDGKQYARAIQGLTVVHCCGMPQFVEIGGAA